ncbi:hypothetical protein [Desulfosporosinus fructosivorans]
MSMTITEKILAQHAGLDNVVPGQLITAKLDISQGDEVEIDVATGIVENRTTNIKYQANSFPPFMQDLIRAGGLISYIEGRNNNA